MRLNGKELPKANPVIVALPRTDENGEHQDIIFEIGPVVDYEEFDALVEAPKPPVKVKPGGDKEVNYNDETYMKRLNEYAEKRSSWIVLKSLSFTKGLEWNIVDLGKPDTWSKWQEEMKLAGLSESEILQVMRGVSAANQLDEERLKEARDRFLALKRAQAKR